MNALHVGILIAVLVILGAAWISASSAIIRSTDLTAGGRALWLAAVLVFPVLGPAAWIASRRRPR